jgi:hypothetical protein
VAGSVFNFGLHLVLVVRSGNRGMCDRDPSSFSVDCGFLEDVGAGWAMYDSVLRDGDSLRQCSSFCDRCAVRLLLFCNEWKGCDLRTANGIRDYLEGDAGFTPALFRFEAKMEDAGNGGHLLNTFEPGSFYLFWIL